MKRLLFTIICLSLTLSLFSHPWKPRHYVIIDTDGGIDDMKAITMLLASPDVRVLAITVSPGSLTSGEAYIKVRSLLNSFYHEGIPVGINRISKFKSPEFPVALATNWGNETGLNEKNEPDHLNLIAKILSAEKTKITFICLGSMSTAATAIKDLPVFKKQVNQIVWSGSGHDEKEGFNYKADIPAAESVLKSDVVLKIVRGLESESFYTQTLLKQIDNLHNAYSRKISDFFSANAANNHSFSFNAYDEMVPLFLHYPNLFTINSGKNYVTCSPRNIDSLRICSAKIISGENIARNQVIRDLPLSPSFYFDDIEPFVTEIINRYGIDEWTSGVIANELHRHLGVFAIIGVKMGIRAREYFNTGVDEFSAVSFAGSMPPLSCMNDGLQVSTGATPGHGLLTVINDAPAIPAVEFSYLDRKIKLTLKPEIAEKISSELKEINFIHGLDSDIYWELVRKNSVKYWRDLDRHEIFDIEEIK
ncbi:MAG: nucleoside hydrolase [Bacteroidales bacterium]|nr:nucleoside hydrolase [Bacteroidales bacterium]